MARSVKIEVRVSPEEKAKIEAHAKTAGFASVSKHLRELALAEPLSNPLPPDDYEVVGREGDWDLVRSSDKRLMADLGAEPIEGAFRREQERLLGPETKGPVEKLLKTRYCSECGTHVPGGRSACRVHPKAKLI